MRATDSGIEAQVQKSGDGVWFRSITDGMCINIGSAFRGKDTFYHFKRHTDVDGQNVDVLSFLKSAKTLLESATTVTQPTTSGDGLDPEVPKAKAKK